MSNTVDRRVVEMRFDNQDFEKNVNTTLTALEKLKERLKFKDAGKDFQANGLGSAVDEVKNRFSALEVIGLTTLTNLTNSAVNLGKHMMKALTVDQITAGFSEYELKMGSIQTIMASTGEELQTVNGYLNELNTYSDRTIYSFSDMTQNIGKFTNAGVKLEDAVNAIKGISNEAAVSGANANEASRAMYNFAQALSAGYVKLIDWKSIENANMATVEFKQALLDTAVAMGTVEKTAEGYKSTTTDANGKVSDLFTSTKGFNESLANQWMTTEVLTQTLQNYSVDLENMSAAEKQAWHDQMLSIGYTEEQIKGVEELSKKAYAAAQDVKTFSQLMDTVKESIGSGWAQTFEILFGDLEEAKKLWTGVNNAISPIIQASADARNSLLQGWEDLGGRAAAIEGIRNIFEALRHALMAVSGAFENVFPPLSSKQLADASKRFRDLTDKLIITGSTFDKVKNVFTAVFSVMKIGLNIAKGIAGVFINLSSLIVPVAKVTLNVLDSIATTLLTMTGGLSDATKGMSDLANAASGGLASGLSSVLSKLTPVNDIVNKLGTAVGKLFSMIGKGLSSFDFAKAGGLAAGGGILAVGLKLSKFIGELTSKAKDIKSAPKIIASLKEVFGELSNTLQEFQTSLKAKSLMTIATAIGILAASCFVLSSIPAKKLAQAVTAVGFLAAELVGASMFVQRAGTKGLVKLAAAIYVLAAAAKTLAGIEGLGNGIAGVAALLTEIVLFCMAFDRLKIKPKALTNTAEGMILMGIALNILSRAVEKLGGMDTGQLVKGLTAVAAMLAGVTLMAFAFSKFNPTGLVKAGSSMILMAAGIKMLVGPVRELGSMSLGSLAKGLGSMAVALLAIAGFTAIMSKISAASGGIIKAGVALTVMAVGVNLVAKAVQTMSATANVGQGLSVLFASLGILAVAMVAMQNALPGAAALVVVGAALMMIAPAIALLSSLNLAGVGVALLALVGTLTAFGVAALVLTPVIPMMIALGAAMALLGVSVLALGAGMTLLAGAFAVGAGAIVSGIQTIAAAMPIIAQAIGTTIIGIITAIADGASELQRAIIELGKLLITALKALGPDLVSMGLFLLVSLLEGIDKNIGRITSLGISIVVKFINGVSSKIGDVVDAGYNLIISFMNAMADAMVENASRLKNALINVLLAAVEAVASLIPIFGDSAAKAIEAYRKNFADGEKPVGDTAKKVSTTADKNLKIDNQYSNGYNSVSGITSGMNAALPSLRRKAAEVAKVVDDTIRKKNEIHSPSRVLARTGKYMMEGLIQGLDSMQNAYQSRAESISTTLLGSTNAALNGLSAGLDHSVTSALDFSHTRALAEGIQVSANGMLEMKRQEELLRSLGSMISKMSDNIVPNQMTNYIDVNGAEEPEAFADRLMRRMDLNARAM